MLNIRGGGTPVFLMTIRSGALSRKTCVSVGGVSGHIVLFDPSSAHRDHEDGHCLSMYGCTVTVFEKGESIFILILSKLIKFSASNQCPPSFGWLLAL